MKKKRNAKSHKSQRDAKEMQQQMKVEERNDGEEGEL